MVSEFPQNAIILSIIGFFIIIVFIRLKIIKGKQILLSALGSLFAILGFSLIYKEFYIFYGPAPNTFKAAASYGYSQWLFPDYVLNILFTAENDVYIHENLVSYICPMMLYIVAAFIYTLGFEKHRNYFVSLIAAFCHGILIILYPLIENLMSGGIVYQIDILRSIFVTVFYYIGFLLGMLFIRIKKCFACGENVSKGDV